MTKQTYGQLWDRYVSDAFPKLQEANAALAFPGAEWGTTESWQRIFDKLFVPADVATWKAAVEIGGGGGKYTELVLRGSADARVFGFDVSRNFLDATGERLAADVAKGRLSLHEIHPLHPDHMLRTIEAAGLLRQVDAMFSIDAMVHVDLQYLTTYWINAALLLRPGGRILMTLADPTTGPGFEKILRDIRKFWKFQGRMCPKFEYLHRDIVTRVLTAIGFEIELLEDWSYVDGRPGRDLYLIARLARTDGAALLEAAITPDPLQAAPPARPKPESYADLWARESARVLAKSPQDRPSPAIALDKLLTPIGLAGWGTAIEIGLGDARFTAAALAANPGLRMLGFDVSQPVLAAATAKLAGPIGAGRLALHKVDPVKPDAMLATVAAAGLTRQVDAVFSIDAMVHVDLQYQMVYWLTAALVLKPGGRLLVQVADATSGPGLAKLLGDIRVYFAEQGQCCTRFEWQSPGVMQGVLTALGFDILAMGGWNPATGGANGRDLIVVAQLARPEQAEALRGSLSIGLDLPAPMPMAAGAAADIAAASTEPAGDDQGRNDAARVLGQAYWRQVTLQSNPDLTPAQLRDMMREQWGGNRREWTRFGHQVLRQLGNLGYTVSPDGTRPRGKGPGHA